MFSRAHDLAHGRRQIRICLSDLTKCIHNWREAVKYCSKLHCLDVKERGDLVPITHKFFCSGLETELSFCSGASMTEKIVIKWVVSSSRTVKAEII